MNKFRQYGFSLVELLIVVVVIAILAAISAVAYNGMQQRGHNAAIISAARAWRDAFATYGTIKGNYVWSGFPAAGVSGSFQTCLGDTSAYPAISGYSSGRCYRFVTGNSELGSTAIYTPLIDEIYTVAKPSGGPYTWTATYTLPGPNIYGRRGISYDYSIDSSHAITSSSIYYTLENETVNCGVADAVKAGTVTSGILCKIDIKNRFTLVGS